MTCIGRWLIVIAVYMLAAVEALAGGSGLNVAVVVNTNSSNSLQMANYFCEQRQVPPQNVLRINWTGVPIEWSLTDYQNTLLTPLLSMLASRQLTNQIDYVVLSMDIPYRVRADSDGVNSTTSALFYGFKPDSRDPFTCPQPLPPGSTNFFAGSEGAFRATPPNAATSNSFLAIMITATNLAQAKQVVDQGVASDGTFPTQTVTLLKTSDSARNVRYDTFDTAIFDTRITGNYSLRRTNSDNAAILGQSLGFEQGMETFSIPPTTFAPGAMADNLTSFGGMIFENTGQTTLLSVLAAGATGSYGTIVEPCNFHEKFPVAENYFYQARGFSLAECYYLSVTNPYEGLIVGEPLAAPFATPCNGSWNGLNFGSVLTGVTNLSAQFIAADAAHPVQQVDLFVDGTFAMTLTNIAPSQNNIVSVVVNGFPTNYVVGADSTIKSVSSAMLSALNQSAYSRATKVRAFLHNDRIELRATNLLVSGSQVTISTSNNAGIAPAATTFIRSSLPSFLDSTASGIRSMEVSTNFFPTGNFLQLTVVKTNGTMVTVSVTNTVADGNAPDTVSLLVNAVNSNPGLQGADGLVMEDFMAYVANGSFLADFNFRARSPGWAAAQIQVTLTGNFNITPNGTSQLDRNLVDLQPRNHLYITAGTTNLPCPFALDTTTLADGWHELTAVAYEGSNIRTQKRIAQTVLIQNRSWSATLDYLVGGINTALEATLQFGVTANTNNIASVELFGTGGSWGVVSNQSTAVFSIPATSLQIGLHSFYAIVTDMSGNQYRTQTRPVRIVGAEPPFVLSITGNSPVLSWPASAGRLYDVLSAASLTDLFQLRGTIAPTSSLALWPETNVSGGRQFYRVRTDE